MELKLATEKGYEFVNIKECKSAYYYAVAALLPVLPMLGGLYFVLGSLVMQALQSPLPGW